MHNNVKNMGRHESAELCKIKLGKKKKKYASYRMKLGKFCIHKVLTFFQSFNCKYHSQIK